MSQKLKQTELRQAIEQVIERCDALSLQPLDRETAKTRIVSSRSVSGGCISQAEIVTLENGRRYFVKSNSSTPDLFVAESTGLAALRSTQTVRVPQVIGTDVTKLGIGFLVLELIETGQPGREFEAEFGRALAEMHMQSRHNRFGFHADNYIGSSSQINQWKTNWVEFWATNRFGFQLSLAEQNGHATAEFSKRFQRIISRLDTLISTDEDASLIHGDLWSGNFMVSASGKPVLIDPAVYYGSREAEFGMTTLFGGFGAEFYDAYQERWPLADGWQDRVELYRLYHLMNHLNLFGAGYFGGCMEILKKYG